MKHPLIFLCCLFLFSMLMRLGCWTIFMTDNPCLLMYDSGHYHHIAMQLVAGNGLAGVDGNPQFYRLPGYPLFLALCYWLFGTVKAALIIQMLLASLIPLLIFFLARRLFYVAGYAAYGAGLIAALHPGFLIFSNLVMTETLFMIFFLLFLIAIFNRSQSLQLMMAGCFLGIAMLIRPFDFYPLVVGTYLFFGSEFPWGKRLSGSLFFMTSLIVTITPWLLRNYLLTGLVFLHTLSGAHFMNHMAVRVVMAREVCLYEEARNLVGENVSLRCLKEGNNNALSEPARSKIMSLIAFDYMIKNPFITLKLAIGNILKTCFSLYSSELLMIDGGGQLPSYGDNRSIGDMIKRFLVPRVQNKWIIPFIYLEILFFLLTLCGFVGWCIQELFIRRRTQFVCALFFLMTPIISFSAACGFARLRLPVEPFLIIVSCMFYRSVYDKRGIIWRKFF